MNKLIAHSVKGASLGIAALIAVTSAPAYATDGSFVNGIGTRNKAMAGSGVADQNDAMAIAINPAGLVNSDTQFNGSFSFFVPEPGYKNLPVDFTGDGVPDFLFSDESTANFFLMPNLAYNHKIDADTAIGVGMYSLFGQGSDYRVPQDFGIELSMGVMSVGFAKRYGNLSFGFAPGLAVELFRAKGTFPAPTPTGFVTFRDKIDIALGFGFRGGVELAVTDNIRLGVSGNSPYWMQDLEKYRGFLGPRGNARVPATVQAGVSVDLFDGFTVSADYKLIANQSSPTFSDNPARGLGFGWVNQNVYKVAFEWDMNSVFTVRGGYSYNTDAIEPEVAPFNILAPAVSKHHITGGAKLKVASNLDLEFAGMYSPSSSVTAPAALGGTELHMNQYEVTGGIVWHLGGE